ncbi:Clavaminate synthase-like protein [Aaosphaeria arxii CBS 175.79]|uniref:Clavaminate synthase-like protein n=1 Tax=Aaosphaeria arxii CBS 175.79 TaxID=1450172 RepID=A0A6A5X5T5_9PLEO|nr:Clavaminate synthase-like protein [Aaosphaeria arxii CBS 175.79]KAF2008355.1 Clavaminate synthase-like protein [Aaosphaeria arxii CBS 175.79]
MATQTSKNEFSAADLLNSALTFINPIVTAPFSAIQNLFDYLGKNPQTAAALNKTYSLRGIFKAAATTNPACDQKLTIDLSPTRIARIPSAIKIELAPHGLVEILAFFDAISQHYVVQILTLLSTIAGRDLISLHANFNVNFRIIDYTTATASPQSLNGCGAHTDYGTFSIIFQDGNAGLEMEAPEAPGTWVSVPGNATVLLCGWCAVVLSGGKVMAVRHRVRRVPGVRRLSAVLFVAPDLNVKLAPAERVDAFSDPVNQGLFDVRWFKEEMGKKWRYREGNGKLEDDGLEQDHDIGDLIWKSF